MLKSLHIENIAVIERADVDLAPGLSVLTGETGAGKSIIIDALNAVLGSRTNRDLVRSGADKALVTAVFTPEAAETWLRDNELETDEELILQRRLTPDGRSSARVNGVPVSASQLRELGALLLDIHGQNDGRQLLDEKNHLRYLDGFGVDPQLIDDYVERYEEYRRLVKEAEVLRIDEADKLQLEDTLRYRIRELEKAEIRPGEEEELLSRRDLLRNAEKLTEFLDEAYEALYDADDSAVSRCGTAEYAADRAGAWSQDMTEAAELIRNARLALEDAAERIRDKREQLDFSPEEYDRMEDRLSQLRRLEKKYAVDEAGLAALLEESRAKLDSLEYSSDRLALLEKDIAAALKTAETAAEALSAERRSAADRLEKQVEKELRELSMPSVRFHVSVAKQTGSNALDRTGADAVRFVMSANAGEALGPISRIASGGELSRIMLALKNVLAARDSVETLIFDEIDTGVSGIAAQRVAEKLAALASDRQVLCVTHLPQIAAMAQTQYLVEKRERDGRTYTDIRSLDRPGRERELARILGGDEITGTILAGAAELLDNAEKYRANLKNH